MSRYLSALDCQECTSPAVLCLDENRTVSGPFLDHLFALCLHSGDGRIILTVRETTTALSGSCSRRFFIRSFRRKTGNGYGCPFWTVYVRAWGKWSRKIQLHLQWLLAIAHVPEPMLEPRCHHEMLGNPLLVRFGELLRDLVDHREDLLHHGGKAALA